MGHFVLVNHQDYAGQGGETSTQRTHEPSHPGNHPVRTEENGLTNDKPIRNGQVKLRPVLDLR